VPFGTEQASTTFGFGLRSSFAHPAASGSGVACGLAEGGLAELLGVDLAEPPELAPAQRAMHPYLTGFLYGQLGAFAARALLIRSGMSEETP